MPISGPAPFWSSPDARANLYLGHVVSMLRSLPPRSVHCVVTSPPYWGLRDYGVDGQLGLEPVADCLGWATRQPCGACYVCHMVEVFFEVRRVLRDDGTCWLNLGDKYDGDQLLVPSRVALALQADGWLMRQDIIWYAPNKIPEPVDNRCTKSHEHIFLLAKGSGYYYDNVAIEVGAVRPGDVQTFSKRGKTAGDFQPDDPMFRNGNEQAGRTIQTSDTANKRDVWIVPVANYPGAHFATFNPKLIEPCILAGTSEHGCCAACKRPYERILVREGETTQPVPNRGRKDRDRSFPSQRNGLPGSGSTLDGVIPTKKTVGWQKMCGCATDAVEPCVVLDPFVGSGTTVATAILLGRRGAGIDLSEAYLRDNARPRVEAALAGGAPARRATRAVRPGLPPPPRRARGAG